MSGSKYVLRSREDFHERASVCPKLPLQSKSQRYTPDDARGLARVAASPGLELAGWFCHRDQDNRNMVDGRN